MTVKTLLGTIAFTLRLLRSPTKKIGVGAPLNSGDIEQHHNYHSEATFDLTSWSFLWQIINTCNNNNYAAIDLKMVTNLPKKFFYHDINIQIYHIK